LWQPTNFVLSAVSDESSSPFLLSLKIIIMIATSSLCSEDARFEDVGLENRHLHRLRAMDCFFPAISTWSALEDLASPSPGVYGATTNCCNFQGHHNK
jgi:hypothetical protein